MHVAVCDDNIADRKQTERLLGRESDRRAKITEGLYVDSYGNATALLNTPMLYDIFYIDMCKTEGVTGTDIAHKLCSLGVQVPIYMCCSDIDYRNFSFPENVHFIEKPIKKDDLCASLDHAYDIKKNAVPLIELRAEKETFYVTEEEILYATEDGRSMNVTLTDGRIVRIDSTAENLYDQWCHFDTFLAPNLKTIVNARHITKIGLLQIQMQGGSKFLLNNALREHVKKLFEKYNTP